MTDWVGVLAGGLVGNLVGGFATWKATISAMRQSLESQRQASVREVRGTLRALYVEMNDIWNGYSASYKSNFEGIKEGDIFTIEFPGTGEMLAPIYTSNASKIGSLHDEALIRSIVQYHVQMQALWEAVAVNSNLLRIMLARMSDAGRPDLQWALESSPVERSLLVMRAKMIRERAIEFGTAYTEAEARMVTALGQAADP